MIVIILFNCCFTFYIISRSLNALFSIFSVNEKIYRCVGCYEHLQVLSKILMRRAGSKFSVNAHPVMDAFMSIPFLKLTARPTAEEAKKLLEGFPVHVVTSPDSLLGFYLQWHGVCPCCYDMVFLDPPPVLGSIFSTITPNVSSVETLRLPQVTILRHTDGSLVTKDIILSIVTCQEVVSRQDAIGFKFRAADELEHTCYHGMIVPAPDTTLDWETEEQWHLLRGITKEGDAISLSLTCVGAVERFLGSKEKVCNF